MKKIEWKKQAKKALAEQRKQNKSSSKIMLGEKIGTAIKPIPINIRPLKK